MDCAQNVGISSYYLSHIFRERTGMTFVDILSGVRMQEAKRLCTQTDLTLKRNIREMPICKFELVLQAI